jgi:hypothetical protein
LELSSIRQVGIIFPATNQAAKVRQKKTKLQNKKGIRRRAMAGVTATCLRNAEGLPKLSLYGVTNFKRMSL